MYVDNHFSIIIKYSHLSHDVITYVVHCDVFRLHTASLHQAMMSTGYTSQISRMLHCDWLVFSSCDKCILILTVSVKHGVVKCLYEHANCLVAKPAVISKEKKHLSSVLVFNSYPLSFLQKNRQNQKTEH